MKVNKSLILVILCGIFLVLTACKTDLVGQAGEGAKVPPTESPKKVLCQGQTGPIPAEIPLPDNSASQYYPQDCKDVEPPLLPDPQFPIVQAAQDMCDNVCQGKKPDGSPCEGKALGMWKTPKQDFPNDPPGGCIVTLTYYDITCYCDP